MSAAEQILAEVLRCLREAEVPAQEAYGACRPVERTEMTAVSIQRFQSLAAGLDGYLGRKYDRGSAGWQELYGRKMEVWLELAAYAPLAAGCAALLERAHDALTAGLAAGLRPEEMSWEQATWDTETGLYRQKAVLRCRAFLVAAVPEETGQLLDFRLKGVPEI